MKHFLYRSVCFLMIFMLIFACACSALENNSSGNNSGGNNNIGGNNNSGGDFKNDVYAAPIKVGVLVHNASDKQQKIINDYLSLLSVNLDVALYISDVVNSAETERAAIELWIKDGVKGIISFVKYMPDTELSQIILEKQIYFVRYALPQDEEIEAFKGNPYFIGGLGPTLDEESKSSYDMAFTLLKKVNKDVKMLVLSGGDELGMPMYQERYKGILKAVEDFTYENYNVDIIKIAGFKNTEGFEQTFQQEIAKKPDIVISTTDDLFILDYISKMEGYDPVVGIMTAMNDIIPLDTETQGKKIDFICTINPQVSVIAFALLYNFLTGYTDFVPSDSFPAAMELKYLRIKTEEELNMIENGDLFTLSDFKDMCVKYNEKADFAKVLEKCDMANNQLAE